MRLRFLLVIFCFLSTLLQAQQRDDSQLLRASKDFLWRVLGNRANGFSVCIIPPAGTSDVFELENHGGRILLKGNNPIAVAGALKYYLTNYAHCQITWNGSNLKLPPVLPKIRQIERHVTPFRYRYYLNYCTFSYSMAWWDWRRWQREIDWMALNGINMPLSLTGQDAVWRRVYHQFGLTDGDLGTFFTGPAYFAWSWMGNLDGWNGPLPQSWSDSHEQLERQILKREREMGMMPILSAFTGHVPAALKQKYPAAKIRTARWGIHPEELYVLDPDDPLFLRIGSAFLKEQTATYGSDHYYAADTFNENEPPSIDSAYLDNITKKVYQSMQNVDPAARWVMQGWLFYHDPKFWQEKQIKAVLNAVPDDRMILLDLISEVHPVWNWTNAYYGKPWIWCMVHNFGGNIGLFGRMRTIAAGPAMALHSPTAGKLSGIGLTPEGIEQNPALYQLMVENVWRNQPIQLGNWLKQYTWCRYGVPDIHANKAWQILSNTVYAETDKMRDCPESIITGRPTFDSSARWTITPLHYRPEALLPAWKELLNVAPAARNTEGFRYDLADVTRQVLANYGDWLQQRFARAYREHNVQDFKYYSGAFVSLINDMDRLLATQKSFMLGPWLQSAKKWGSKPAEQALYERNARNLITLWGDKNSPLHEYACRQWSGLLNGFYRPRWEIFRTDVLAAMQSGRAFNPNTFEEKIKNWEWHWVNAQSQYPAQPAGDTYAVALALYHRYISVIKTAYQTSGNQHPIIN